MEVYFSRDVEADGPIPGPNSMLSLGCAAFKDDRLQNTFSVNLEFLDGATPDEHTTEEFWDRNKSAYAATRTISNAPALRC